jgi:hypothetical protein
VKFIVPGVPQGAQPSAFAPHFNRQAGGGAQMYKGAVTGQPGTMGIPAPTRDTVPSPDAGDAITMGTARSMDAPDTWYPQKYFERSLNGDGTMGPVTPVAIYSDNLMPVPAVDPRGRPARLAKRTRNAGQTAVGMPRALPQWGGS